MSILWTALYTHQTHMQSFHAARSGRAATVRMVARSADRARIRMGTQNSSTPPRTDSFQLRTVDTDHESSPGIPEIYRQQLSTIHLSLELHRHTLTHATLTQINAYLKE
jgi:hypothetical protein